MNDFDEVFVLETCPGCGDELEIRRNDRCHCGWRSDRWTTEVTGYSAKGRPLASRDAGSCRAEGARTTPGGAATAHRSTPSQSEAHTESVERGN